MTDSAIPDISTVDSPPRKSLDYSLLDIESTPIDTGGQAVVYEASVNGIDGIDRIALKEPKGGDTLTTEATESFLEEAHTWEIVDKRERKKPRWGGYEHIVGVIDTGDTLPWIAMEYMDGGSLNERLKDNPNGLPVDEALWIGECLCHGLEVAHSYGIAHLDLKPANILFRRTKNGCWDVPKIADWGLARVLSEQTGTMDGLSVKYSSPEQFNPEEYGDPDGLTDIYQVGAILYTMLTGRPPYSGSNTSVMHDIVYGEDPSSPSSIRTELSQPIDIAIKIALEGQKTDRYRSVAKFEEVLRAIRTDQSLPHMISQYTNNRDKYNIDNDQNTSFIDTEEAILERVARNPEMTNAEIAQDMDVGIALVRDVRDQHGESGEGHNKIVDDTVDASDATGGVGPANELSQTEQTILETITEEPNLTNAEIAKKVGVRIPLVRDLRKNYRDVISDSRDNLEDFGTETPKDEIKQDSSNGTGDDLIELLENIKGKLEGDINKKSGATVSRVRDIREKLDQLEDTNTARGVGVHEEIMTTILKNPSASNGEIAEKVDVTIPVVRDVRNLMTDELNITQYKIVNYVIENPSATNAEVAKAVGVGIPVVRDIREMVTSSTA